MDEEIKKKVAIGIAIGCIAVAAAITIITSRGGSDGSKTVGQIQFLCVNPQCGNAFESNGEEINKQKGEGISMADMPPVKCPKCGQDSAYAAIKCEKCGNIFIPNYDDPKEYDKCPKCGYSKDEQLKKKKGQQ
jgi:DNA-directed RNA polymerase subunit M/transcription elongation factor TFIIS